MLRLLLTTALTLGTASAAIAEDTAASNVGEAFQPANAILDTGILFAAGARQETQTLRGAFGWPTFQEGSINDIYFRFDPDGYARFSPSPRLETDIFEVLCRPRTHACVARKGDLSITLRDDGTARLALDGLTGAETLLLDDGFSRIEVPGRVIGDLNPQLEYLLYSGSDLVATRGDQEVQRASLVGLEPVIAFLRWIAARQNYEVLPPNWAFPSGVAAPVDDVSAWAAMGRVASAGVGLGTPAQPFRQDRWASPTADFATSSGATDPMSAPQLVAMQARLTQLERLLGQAMYPDTTTSPIARDYGAPQGDVPGQATYGSPSNLYTIRPGASQGSVLPTLETPLAGNAPRQTDPAAWAPPIASDLGAVTTQRGDNPGRGAESFSTASPAEHLAYLTDRMGLDTETAIMVLQMTPTEDAAPSIPTAGLPAPVAPTLADQVLAELDTILSPAPTGTTPFAAPATPPTAGRTDENDFQSLTAYFTSVMTGN
ncbi:MAG: hypothetical protein ACU0CI_07595 [Shimia sp.]